MNVGDESFNLYGVCSDEDQSNVLSTGVVEGIIQYLINLIEKFNNQPYVF